MRELTIGTKVKLSRVWLKSIGAYTGSLPFARGTITGIMDLGSIQLAIVKWDNPDAPAKVNTKNLVELKDPEVF
jgi:hypothetical protein